MRRSPDQWPAAIAAIEDEHVQACVRDYLRSLLQRAKVVERLKSTESKSAPYTPGHAHTSGAFPDSAAS